MMPGGTGLVVYDYHKNNLETQSDFILFTSEPGHIDLVHHTQMTVIGKTDIDGLKSAVRLLALKSA